MVIAMIAMRMVQFPLVEIVLVISMGNDGMVAALVSARASNRCTSGGILRGHFEHMFIIMPLVGGMQMSIVQVIDMVVMDQRQVPTLRSMSMRVLIVDGMTHQETPLFGSHRVSFPEYTAPAAQNQLYIH